MKRRLCVVAKHTSRRRHLDTRNPWQATQMLDDPRADVRSASGYGDVGIVVEKNRKLTRRGFQHLRQIALEEAYDPGFIKVCYRERRNNCGIRAQLIAASRLARTSARVEPLTPTQAS